MAENGKTQREMYNYIAELLADNEEVVAFCEKKIAQIDSRKTAPRKVDPVVQERRDAIVGLLGGQENPMTVKDIADNLGYTSPQVTGAIRGLINTGQVEVVLPEKKSDSKMYKLSDTDVTDQFLSPPLHRLHYGRDFK